ncbi:uncharacterized protein LOC105390593 isoform X1 [Plutella xylostella]|uniref:uncharacterized protein LOC105390593 isoform X1 n=1 Tax=Plutella xylostella TaxID=51655 RepID=UPI0020323D6F|nr:uncharacterized protein LOC105390593 isoform X1 [Plutella xylostella]
MHHATSATLLPQSEELTRHHRDAAQPRLVHTQFGYILAGNLPEFSHGNSAVSLFCRDCKTDLNSTMKQFWQSESVPQEFTEHESEKVQCEEHFQKTVKLENKQFEVSIPLKVPIYDINNYIGDSLSLALKRFLNLEKKLHNDPSLFKEYKSFIDEYIDLGHASSVDISQYDLNKDPIYFIPHHAVLKPDAVSTKLRVVMDAGMKGSNKMSLNDLLLTGPVIQADMFDILHTSHKWCANNSAILSDIPTEKQQHSDELEFQKEIKTLGLKFNVNTDSFQFAPMLEQPATTKRQILSFISQFFDLLGLAGPLFVQAKEIMQSLWTSKVGWDSAPPPEILTKWQEFYSSLTRMQPLTIKRNVCLDNQTNAELVGFSDSSAKAYGCAIYLRATDKNGKISMSLISSKPRITPLNSNLSMPRLELNAALLLAKTMARVYDSLKDELQIQNVYIHSDSQVVLAWLKTNPIKLNAYVANRIKLMQQLTNNYLWSYIKTDQNPADCLSRGVSPCDLMQHPLWFNGPKFMLDPDYKFTEFNYEAVKCNLPEVKVVSGELNEGGPVCAASLKVNNVVGNIITKYSSISKAQRVLAYVQRFISNLKKTRSEQIKCNYLTYSELNQALLLIIKHEQMKYFSSDIKRLQEGKQTESSLKGLNPFLDADGLLRVGGRLQHSALPYAQKHQIILPNDSYVTQLIVRNEHVKLLP